VLALAALLLAIRPDPDPARAGPDLVSVVVAARDLPPGTVLAGADLTVARWPASLRPAGTVADPSDALGRILAGGVRAAEPLTDVRFVGTGLTELLPPGLVAAPVRLADLAVSALVEAGDRVDVLAAAPDAGQAEVVAEGALVLAAPGAPVADGQPDPVAGLLLLAVEPATAARLAAAATTSTLTVSLPAR
jgi:Flp pilus assembly protein CpaB